MLKRLMCAAALACSAPLALAAPTIWQFTYTGFYSPTDGQFLPDATIAGSFTGSDGNHNGIVERSELSSFIVSGLDYAGCATETIPYFTCALSRFSYALSGALDFSAGNDTYDEYNSWYYSVTTGVGSFYTRLNPAGQEDYNLLWTAATTVSIVPLPVPEPTAPAMLLAGVALLAAARRGAGRTLR
jgi:hypothetical protein